MVTFFFFPNLSWVPDLNNNSALLLLNVCMMAAHLRTYADQAEYVFAFKKKKK